MQYHAFSTRFSNCRYRTNAASRLHQKLIKRATNQQCFSYSKKAIFLFHRINSRRTNNWPENISKIKRWISAS